MYELHSLFFIIKHDSHLTNNVMPVNIFKTYIANYKLKLYEQSPNPKKTLYAIKHHQEEVIVEEESDENLKKSYKKFNNNTSRRNSLTTTTTRNTPVICLEGVEFRTETPKVVAKFYHGIWKPAPAVPSPRISPRNSISVTPACTSARSNVSVHNSPFTQISSPQNFLGSTTTNSVAYNYKKVHTFSM